MPDDRNEVLTGGMGAKGSNDYALLWLALATALLALAYVPSGRTVSVDLGRLATPIRARWSDPTTASYTDVAGLPPLGQAAQATGATVANLRTPGPNGAGDPDWVLVLETAR